MDIRTKKSVKFWLFKEFERESIFNKIADYLRPRMDIHRHFYRSELNKLGAEKLSDLNTEGLRKYWDKIYRK